MITSAKNWRRPREEGVELTFPSGNIASIRPITTALLVRLGRVPDVLLGAFAKNVLEGAPIDIDTSNVEMLKAYYELLDGVCLTSFITPEVVEAGVAPGDGQITIDDVSTEDKEWLLLFLNKPASKLRSFRAEQESDVEPVDAQPGYAPAPVGTDEPEPVGG